MLSKDAPAKDAPPGEPPRPSFVLMGREVGTDLFRLGLDARAGRYYFWYSLGREGHAWHGRQEYAGAPDVEAMPVDPTQLVEVLGVTELPDRPGTLPAAAMTLQTDPCAYVVCCLKPQPVSGRMRTPYSRLAIP
jgi:hypothetical protein